MLVLRDPSGVTVLWYRGPRAGLELEVLTYARVWAVWRWRGIVVRCEAAARA